MNALYFTELEEENIRDTMANLKREVDETMQPLDAVVAGAQMTRALQTPMDITTPYALIEEEASHNLEALFEGFSKKDKETMTTIINVAEYLGATASRSCRRRVEHMIRQVGGEEESQAIRDGMAQSGLKYYSGYTKNITENLLDFTRRRCEYVVKWRVYNDLFAETNASQ